METFDYVIVGAGSAGSVLANRLSEDEKVTVCVLEAGPWDWHPFIHIPAGFMYTLVNPRVNWLYTSEASEWTGGRRIAAPRGKTLGGSSSINGHIYNRGQRLDFDGWAQRGNHGWGYADVLPYFRRTERRMGNEGGTERGLALLRVTEAKIIFAHCAFSLAARSFSKRSASSALRGCLSGTSATPIGFAVGGAIFSRSVGADLITRSGSTLICGAIVMLIGAGCGSGPSISSNSASTSENSASSASSDAVGAGSSGRNGGGGTAGGPCE